MLPVPAVPDAVPVSQEPGSAAMAEESSSGSSGSPGAGDTLPWNLGKHQRSQRAKAAAGNGTVLDPAERAVIRIAAEEQDFIQAYEDVRERYKVSLEVALGVTVVTVVTVAIVQ
ncbi:hypothetical protein TURU_157806 [Turdus rufiventris]|nr:hypothetical protein TURU_157806 [Turdus rufiventris]